MLAEGSTGAVDHQFSSWGLLLLTAALFFRVTIFLLAFSLCAASIYHSVHNEEPDEATADDYRELQPSHNRLIPVVISDVFADRRHRLDRRAGK